MRIFKILNLFQVTYLLQTILIIFYKKVIY